MSTCNQRERDTVCGAPAAARYTWPGKDEAFICAVHLPKLRAVADAMGLALQVIPVVIDVDFLTATSARLRHFSRLWRMPVASSIGSPQFGHSSAAATFYCHGCDTMLVGVLTLPLTKESKCPRCGSQGLERVDGPKG